MVEGRPGRSHRPPRHDRVPSRASVPRLSGTAGYEPGGSNADHVARGSRESAPSLLSPWPFYDSELEGAAQFSVIVVSAFAITVVALIVFSLAAIRRGRRGPTFLRLHGALRPWFMLLIWTLAWYVPGLGWLFAVAITPEIRSWGRLSVVVAYIASVVAGMLIAEFVQGSRKRTGLVAAALAVLLGWQLAQDHRAVVIPARSSELHAAGSSYAEGIRQVLPDGCPVLQLPALRFPEEWREEWEDAGMSAYDHMWVHLYAPELQWTFGAPRGSQGDAEAQVEVCGGADLGSARERSHGWLLCRAR